MPLAGNEQIAVGGKTNTFGLVEEFGAERFGVGEFSLPVGGNQAFSGGSEHVQIARNGVNRDARWLVRFRVDAHPPLSLFALQN